MVSDWVEELVGASVRAGSGQDSVDVYIGQEIDRKQLKMELRNSLVKIPAIWDRVYFLKNEADYNHHRWSRIYFMDLLDRRDRTIELFNRWTLMTGMVWPAMRLQLAMKHIQLLHDRNAGKADIDIAELQSAHRRHELKQALWHCNLAPVAQSAEQYVDKELKLPWTWIVWDLIDIWSIFVWNGASGERLSLGINILDTAPEVEFKSVPNESYADMLERLAAFKEEQDAKFRLAQRMPKGSSQENVKRYVQWYYKNKIEGISTEELARLEPSKREGGADASNIRAWIRKVDVWLSLADIEGGFD